MAQAAVQGKGLEGVVAASSAISSIMGSTLTYRGIDIDELAERSTFEEVVYLLWYGELPTRQQLDRLCGDLAGSRSLAPEVIDAMRRFPPEANTMVAVRTVVSLLAFYDPLSEEMSAEANEKEARLLLARFPTIVAAIHRIRRGENPIAPDPSLNEAENFLYMLKGKRPTQTVARIMDVALVLHADHELNASTFAARIAASTLSDMDSAVVAALCTLKGPLHGGANQAVMETLERIVSPDDARGYVRDALERKEKIMGFGHRVYREGDPRARWLKQMSQQLSQETGNPRWFETSRLIEEQVLKQRGLLPNVDFYSASVHMYLDIPKDLFTPIFAMSRMAGYTAHILEQYADNRLIRPLADYVGPDRRGYVPIDER
ncbi:MAG: citrate/2-methylcitrate synthase [Chloroflexota bacterium]|nr:MAG: citrate synthase [Chloroflexota bacterium]